MLLRVAERGIYGNPASPYRKLLQLAGCELGDLRALVAQRGVDGALSALRREGVYVTFEEFKGRCPIVRFGQEIDVGTRSFNNPRLKRYYLGRTSGSTGPPARTAIDLDHARDRAPELLLSFDAYGVQGVPTAVWGPILPGVASLATILGGTIQGQSTERWFSPLGRDDVRPSLRDRAATAFILAAGRASGTRLPRPEVVPLERPEAVARWVREALDRRGACLLRGHVSSLLRVALVAGELGLDLTGATFTGGGEPPTDAKVAPIRAVGARYFPTYFLTEVGAIGLGCANAASVNDLHVMTDAVAVIQHPVEVAGCALGVDALHITTLLGSAPKILFNVESDDFGVVEERACGCALEAAGFRIHVRDVRSHRKLTGEGMSLVGSDMMRILEEVLPARFGGSPLDFQLVQEEDQNGFTRLVLLAHPRLGHLDESSVVEAVLDALGRGDDASELARATWKQARTLRVRREAPESSNAGKFLPLRPLGVRGPGRPGVQRAGRKNQ